MLEITISAIVLITIIFFVVKTNERQQKKISAEKKRQEQIIKDAQNKKEEELRNALSKKQEKLKETKRMEKVRLQKIEDEKKRLELINQRKKSDETYHLEMIRIQKLEEEKYEIFKIVATGQSNNKFTCVLKRNNKTYADFETSNTALQVGNSIKILKSKANDFDWISEIQHYKKQKEKKEEIEQRNFCESNTVFSQNIRLLQNQNSVNFNSIRLLSVNYVNQLSKETANKLHFELNSGVTIIETEAHLHKYIQSYGNMHQAKLLQSFQAIPNFFEVIDRKQIEIIDYGCGQGIGSIVFYEFLSSVHWGKNMNHRGWQCSIDKIRLIEPSELALKRASLNLKAILSREWNDNVISIHKTIEQIDLQDLSSNASAIKFHIFSNILDVDDFNIEKLAQKIIATQKGINYFICISPKFWEVGVNPRNLRLDAFMRYFQQRHNVSLISTRESNINSWTRYERVFKVTI
jgi:hypothetical protein